MQGCNREHRHGQCRRNVSRAHDDVALSATSSLCDCVRISLDLEQKTLELLNRPTSVGVDVQVKLTSGSGVRNSTLLSDLVDRSDDFSVDLSKDLSGENVSKFCFSVQTVDCLKVLCQFQGVLEGLSALDLAVTVTFSIENAIWLKELPLSPSFSASSVLIP